MSVINNNLLLTAAAGATGYQVSRSLRFNAGDSAFLSKSFGSAGDRKKWTWSCWLKRSALGSQQTLFDGYTDGSNRTQLMLEADNTIRILNLVGGSVTTNLITTAVFRDPSAWYHVLIAWDTAQGTSSNRVKVYINGTEQTSFSTATYPGSNENSFINAANAHDIGRTGAYTEAYLGGYLADIWFLDGIAADPSSFAATDSVTGQWSPKAYAGSKPGNSFHLDFSDNSAATAAALGKDSSGNGLNWTPNNFQVSSTPTYSNYLTNSYTLTDAASAFDGSTATYAQDWNGVYNANYNYEIVFTPPTPISFTSQVRIFGPGGPQSPYSNRYAINLGSGFGSDVSSVQNGWATVATGSGSITAIRSRSNQNGCFIGAIEIDGVILVQSPGSAVDVLVDTPSSYGTDDSLGGSVRGNYATINPLAGSTIHTVSNGNLTLTATNANWSRKISTIGMSSGKWYAEFTLSTAGDNTNQVGVVSFIPPVNGSNQNGEETGQSMYNGYNSGTYNGTIFVDGTRVLTGQTTASSGDVIGVALDASSNNVKYYRNGTLVGSSSGYTPTNVSGTWYFVVQCLGSGVVDCNFGQRAWAYTPPANHRPLVDTLLPSPIVAKSSTAFDIKLWTGTGGSQTISGLNFSPDLIWLKQRSGSATAHSLHDIVRGANKHLASNATDAEVDVGQYGGGVTAFNSDGFSLGTWGAVSSSNQTYVGWCFDGGTTTVTDNTGSIQCSRRTNANAGFSIISWTGTGADGSIGTGLGVTPKMVITKNRTDGGTPWVVDLINVLPTSPSYLLLNSTQGANPGGSTATSSVVNILQYNDRNGSGKAMIMYAFAPVAGYSSFGSYTGNGSTDGPFVFTGHRSRWVMVKRTDTTGNWVIVDTARDTYNYVNSAMYADSSQSESSVGAGPYIDCLSNGFKVRTSTYGNWNANGGTYIYCSFAESPFQYARAR